MKNFVQKDKKLFCADCNKEMKIIDNFVYCENCEKSIEKILEKPKNTK